MLPGLVYQNVFNTRRLLVGQVITEGTQFEMCEFIWCCNNVYQGGLSQCILKAYLVFTSVLLPLTANWMEKQVFWGSLFSKACILCWDCIRNSNEPLYLPCGEKCLRTDWLPPTWKALSVPQFYLSSFMHPSLLTLHLYVQLESGDSPGRARITWADSLPQKPGVDSCSSHLLHVFPSLSTLPFLSISSYYQINYNEKYSKIFIFK